MQGSWFPEEFGCTFLTNIVEADAGRQRGLVGGRYAMELLALKYNRFPELDLQRE